MTNQVAALGVVVTTNADGTTLSLEKLAQAGGKAEASTRQVETAATQLSTAFSRSVGPIGTMEKQLKAAQMAGLNATRQFTDIGVSLASGAPPMMVLIQQLPQLADGFQMAKTQGAGMGDIFKVMLGGIGPLTAGLGLLAGAAVAVGVGWMRGRDSAREYEMAVTGVGRVAGLTAADLRALTVEAAEQGRISVSAAREQATAFLRTGQVGAEVLPRLIAIGKDYAATMGVDAAEATKQLASAMGDPEKAANHLTTTMGLLTQAQIRQIEKMQEAGDLLGAQKILLEGVEQAMKGQAGQVDELTSAWDAMGRSIGDAIEKFGEWLYVTEDEKLAKLNRAIASAQRQIAAGDRLRPGYLDDLVRERDAIEAVAMAERNAANVRAAEAAVNQRAQRQYIAGEDERREAERRAEQAARAAAAERKRAAAELERQYESLITGGERFRDGLQRQIDTYGMAEIDVIRFNAALEAQKVVAEGNTAEAVKLAHSILDAADAYTKLKVEMDKIVPPEDRTLTPFYDETPLKGLKVADLDRTIIALREIEDGAYRAGYGLSEAFGEAGRSMADMLDTMAGFPRALAEIARAQVAGELDPAQAAKKRRDVTIEAYGDMASAAKGFFAEGSRGYRAMQAVEMTYRAFQLAQSVASIAQGWVEASQSVAQATVKAGADTAAGGAKMFSQLGIFAFPAIGAMVAVLAGLGGGSRGGGASYTPPALNVGAGTVSGDPTASSESIANSLEFARRYQDQDLNISRGMLSALEAIEGSIGSLVDALAQQISGGAFSTDGLGLGTSTSGGFLGIGSTTRTRELAGQGLDLNAGTLSQLIANGVSGSLFQLITNTKVKSGFLGIGGSTTTWTSETRSPMDAALSRELGNILASLRQGVLAAAATLGLDGAQATLDSMVIALGRIDFSGLSSSEISQRLTQVFSSVGDQMALALVPELTRFQRAGEGLFETLTRLATEVSSVNVALSSIGMSLTATGIAGIEARSRLVELSGGLDDFLRSVDFFSSNFLTEAQRLAPVQALVTAELSRLGLAADLTREQFANTVLGLDLSTAAGAEMFASLMRLAPSFDVIASAAEDAASRMAEQAARIADQRGDLEIQLMELNGNAAGAIQARRDLELAALDETLHALQMQVWATQDAATAQQALTRAQEEAARSAEQYQQTLVQGVETARGTLSQAYQREAGELQSVIDRFDGFSTSLRTFSDSLGADATGGLSLSRALAEFNRTAQQARLGDETALGGLQGAAQTYLDQARANAASASDYAFAVARVRNQIGLAADTADRQKTLAEQQLDGLKALVSPLIDIDQSVVSVHDAIVALHNALRVAGLPIPAPAAPMAMQAAPAPTWASNDNGDTGALLSEMRQMNARLERVEANTAQSAISSNRTARTLDRLSPDGDSLLVTTAA